MNADQRVDSVQKSGSVECYVSSCGGLVVIHAAKE